MVSWHHWWNAASSPANPVWRTMRMNHGTGPRMPKRRVVACSAAIDVLLPAKRTAPSPRASMPKSSPYATSPITSNAKYAIHACTSSSSPTRASSAANSTSTARRTRGS